MKRYKKLFRAYSADKNIEKNGYYIFKNMDEKRNYLRIKNTESVFISAEISFNALMSALFSLFAIVLSVLSLLVLYIFATIIVLYYLLAILKPWILPYFLRYIIYICPVVSVIFVSKYISNVNVATIFAISVYLIAISYQLLFEHSNRENKSINMPECEEELVYVRTEKFNKKILIILNCITYIYALSIIYNTIDYLI